MAIKDIFGKLPFMFGQQAPQNIFQSLRPKSFENVHFNLPGLPGQEQPQQQQLPVMRPRIPMPEQPQMQTPAFDAYRAYLESMPQRQNPNIWTKLAAGLGGASEAYFNGPARGIAVTQEMMDLPYNRQMSDWQTKGEGMRQAASLESLNLGRENSAVRNQITYELGSGKNLAEFERNEINREGNMIKLQIARETLARANWQLLDIDDQGHPVVVDRNSGKTQILSDVNMMSPAEELDARLKNALQRARIGANATLGAATIGANAQRDTTQMNIDAGRWDNQGTPVDMSVIEPRVRQEAIARLLQEMGSRAQKFIVNAGGSPTLMKPDASGGLLGFGQKTIDPDFAEVKRRYNEIVNELKASNPRLNQGQSQGNQGLVWMQDGPEGPGWYTRE